MKKLSLKPNKHSGKLIVFEGVDGAGKTTLLTIASDYLTKQNIPHIALKMPSEFIRSHPIFNAYDNSPNDIIRSTVSLEHLTVFVSGDRLITLDAQIIPALKQGFFVLCDRYCFTGYMHAPSALIRSICNKFIKPNLVVMPTATCKTLKQRVTNRANEKDNYYNEQAVREQIKKFNSLFKKHKFIKINTEQEQNAVNKNLYTILNSLIK